MPQFRQDSSFYYKMWNCICTLIMSVEACPLVRKIISRPVIQRYESVRSQTSVLSLFCVKTTKNRLWTNSSRPTQSTYPKVFGKKKSRRMLLLSNIISVLSSHHEILWWQCHARGKIFGNKHRSSLMERQMEQNRGETPEVGMLWSANLYFLFLLQLLVWWLCPWHCLPLANNWFCDIRV